MVDEENQFLLVNKLEKELQGKIKPVIGLESYDLDSIKKNTIKIVQKNLLDT